MHFEAPVLGLTGRWRFPEKAFGAACQDVRFQLFRTVTFDAKRKFNVKLTGAKYERPVERLVMRTFHTDFALGRQLFSRLLATPPIQ
jgi:hypothetical protein